MTRVSAALASIAHELRARAGDPADPDSDAYFYAICMLGVHSSQALRPLAHGITHNSVPRYLDQFVDDLDGRADRSPDLAYAGALTQITTWLRREFTAGHDFHVKLEDLHGQPYELVVRATTPHEAALRARANDLVYLVSIPLPDDVELTDAAVITLADSTPVPPRPHVCHGLRGRRGPGRHNPGPVPSR